MDDFSFQTDWLAEETERRTYADGALVAWRRWSGKSRVDHTWCGVRAGGGMWLIDPEEGAWAEDGEHPLAVAGVVVTSGNHGRGARAAAARAGVAVHGHRRALEEAGLEGVEIAEGDALAGGRLRVVALPGFGAGEVALVDDEAGRVHFGDAVIHLPETGLAVLPVKYCDDLAQGRAGLRRLARFVQGVKWMTFAHGWPLRTDAEAALEKLTAPVP